MYLFLCCDAGLGMTVAATRGTHLPDSLAGVPQPGRHAFLARLPHALARNVREDYTSMTMGDGDGSDSEGWSSHM
jgi:hypothetical protein